MTLSMRTIASCPVRGPALILLAATLLAGCQSAAERPAPGPAARADGWRVVERLGDIRHLPPGATSWGPAMSGTLLPLGSQVITGHGGRLILARDDVQVSAGTNSRFTLPDGERQLAQSAGTLRYRMRRADGVRLRVETPTLDLEADRAVFDVAVSATATEVQVEDGRIVVATPGDERRAVLHAGHAARSSHADRQVLAVRTAPGQAFERVGPEVLPAIAPKPAKRPSEPAPGRSSVERGPAATQSDHTAMATVSRGLKGSAVRPAGYRAPQPEAADEVAPAPTLDQPAAAASSGLEHPVDQRQRRFDRLTHGLLHGLSPARP
jgi:hypothetical protein